MASSSASSEEEESPSRSNSSERPRLLKASSLRTELGVATAEGMRREEEEEEEWIRRVVRREKGEKKGLLRERAKQPDLFLEVVLENSR